MRIPKHIQAVHVVALVLSVSIVVYTMPLFSGAIFTSDQAGQPVNQNIYSYAQDVYLNGGPNNNNSSGLPANTTFYFQVTDPSGRVLLSADLAECRQVVTNADGRIYGVPAGPGCFHSVGTVDPSNGSLAVQLYPFNPTPNKGGEYKVWLIPVSDATIADDGRNLEFSNRNAKTDNYKLRNAPNCIIALPGGCVPPLD